jgi:serine/threonine protein kinase
VTEELEFQQYEVNVLKVLKEAQIELVPRIIDIFEDATFLSIVMDYYNAPNLLTWLKQNPDVYENKIKAIFLKICQTLDSLHSMGIVHRDIKLENILIDP